MRISRCGCRKLNKLFRCLLSTIKFANHCCRGTKELDVGFGDIVRVFRFGAEVGKWMGLQASQ